MTAEEFNNMSDEELKHFSDNLCEETFKGWEEEIRQQRDEAEHEAAQYSEDRKSLFKYEGTAETYAVREGTTKICKEAFSGNETLTVIHIPASVNSIHHDAFNGCNNLVAIEVDNENGDFYSEDGILYSKASSQYGETLFRCPMAKVIDVLHINQSTIWWNAFKECQGIREIFISPEAGEGIKIRSKAFSKSNICFLHLNIANSKNEFATDIFDECVEEIEVYAPIPTLITSQRDVFNGEWQNVWCDHFPTIQEEKYEVIQDEEGGIYSADGIRLVKYMGQGNIYKIKEGTRIISARAFEEKLNLVSLSIPKSVEYISKKAVSGCPNLCHVYINPNNVGRYELDDDKLVHEEEQIFTFNKIY